MKGTKPPSDQLIRRVPAQLLEDHLLTTLRRLEIIPQGDGWDRAIKVLKGVQLRSTDMVLTLGSHHPPVGMGDLSDTLALVKERTLEGERAWLEEGVVKMVLPLRTILRGGRTWLMDPSGSQISPSPIAHPDRTLTGGLRKAHRIAKAMGFSPLARPETLTQAGPAPDPYLRKLCRLAFLAPDIQKDLMAGRHPPGLTLQAMMEGEIPPLWSAQRAWIRKLASGTTV
jgi:hypothetical protein